MMSIKSPHFCFSIFQLKQNLSTSGSIRIYNVFFLLEESHLKDLKYLIVLFCKHSIMCKVFTLYHYASYLHPVQHIIEIVYKHGVRLM